jgi:hypothetical protein
MPNTATRTSFSVRWALALSLVASALIVTPAAAEPATTPEILTPSVSVPAIRDQWYLDPAMPLIVPAIAVPTRDAWYLEHPATSPSPARSHRDQEES